MDKNIIFKFIKKENITEQSLFEDYLGFDIDLKKRYTNPFRVDNHRGCFFSIRPLDNRLIFVDWGFKRYDIFDVVQAKFGISFKDAVKKVAFDLKITEEEIINLKKSETKEKEKQKQESNYQIKVKRKKFSKKEFDFWNLDNIFDFTEDYLQSYNLYSLECFWEYKNGNCIRFYDNLKFHFLFTSSKKYQIYNPFYKNKQRKWVNSPELRFGGLEKEDENCNYIVITKSFKDYFYIKQFGVNCFYIINEKILLNKDFMFQLGVKYDFIFTLFDNDRTGISLSWLYRRRYNTIPLFVKIGKDFTENLKHIGKEKMKEEIKNVKTYYGIHI